MLLPLPHLLLALAVMAVWGTNFVVIRFALDDLPPLFLATLRFALVVVPLAFVLKRPAVAWANLAAYGTLIGAGQFGLLFLAMRADITPGLASLVVQTQIFFTIGLSMRLSGETVKGHQLAALALATAGLGVILAHTDGDATPLGVALVLGAALAWSAGNMVQRAAGPVDMLAYVVWGSVFSVPPLLALSLAFEGPAAMLAGLRDASPATWGAVLWQSVGNTMFGYGAWGWLLSRHPASAVTPMALLVPVFGMAASALALGEALPAWKLAAMALVMAGLALNLFW
ncbi:MAG: EamA family transporter, partial [Hyphomonadaceae bacterium]|nr:EamA family transporter [Hyphomonadaceae bacterium]